MRRLVQAVCSVVLSLAVMTVGSPAFAQGKKSLTSATVTGTVAVENGGTGICSVTGGLIYIPGVSILARLGESGAFTLLNVPGATTSLRVEVPNGPTQDFTLNITSSSVNMGTLSVDCSSTGGGTSCNLDSDCGSISLFCSPSHVCLAKLADGNVCSGNNQCVSGNCSNGVCAPSGGGGGGGNPPTCTQTSECIQGYYCGNGTCALKQASGLPCTSNDQCISNVCTANLICQ